MTLFVLITLTSRRLASFFFVRFLYHAHFLYTTCPLGSVIKRPKAEDTRRSLSNWSQCTFLFFSRNTVSWKANFSRPQNGKPISYWGINKESIEPVTDSDSSDYHNDIICKMQGSPFSFKGLFFPFLLVKYLGGQRACHDRSKVILIVLIYIIIVCEHKTLRSTALVFELWIHNFLR